MDISIMGNCCFRTHNVHKPDRVDTWSIDTNDIPPSPEIYEWKTVIACDDDEVFSYGACNETGVVP